MEKPNNHVKMPVTEEQQVARTLSELFQDQQKSPAFPQLHNNLTTTLLGDLEKLIAPNGFRLQQGQGMVVSRVYVPKQDIVTSLLAVYGFIHNDRVKMLQEIDTLIKLYTSDQTHLKGFLAEEEAYPWYKKNKKSIANWKQIIRETEARISTLKVVGSILNR